MAFGNNVSSAWQLRQGSGFWLVVYKDMMLRMSDHVYHEQFDDGPGGWYGWISNAGGPKPLEWRPGQVTSRSPWWIDYNHAPPGAGYMHMVFSLATVGPQGEVFIEVSGENRFISDRCPTDFTHAAMTICTHGELLAQRAQLVWRHRLPEGYVTLDEVRIDFA